MFKVFNRLDIFKRALPASLLTRNLYLNKFAFSTNSTFSKPTMNSNKTVSSPKPLTEEESSFLEKRREQNEKFKQQRLERANIQLAKEKALRTNPYQYKSTGMLKMFYYENKETLVNDPSNVNLLVSVLDNFIKTAKYKDKLPIEQITSQNVVQELLSSILRGISQMSFKSLLKILTLNVSKDNKKMNETLNSFCMTILKKFDFNLILYEEDLINEKIPSNYVTELFLLLTKMQKLVNIYKDKKDLINKFFYFRLKLMDKFLIGENRLNMGIDKLSSEDLISMSWVMATTKLRQIDLYLKITDEMTQSKKFPYLRLKGVVIAMWSSALLNIYNPNLIQLCLEKLNTDKDKFKEEMTTIGPIYIFNLFEFFSKHKNYKIDPTIKNTLQVLFDNNVAKQEQEKRPKCLYMYEMITALKYFLSNNTFTDIDSINSEDSYYKQVDFIINEIDEHFDFIGTNMYDTVFSIYEEILSNNKGHELIKARVMSLTAMLLDKINNKREQLTPKEYINICFSLFSILTNEDKIPSASLKSDIKNFVLSLANETNLSFIIEDLNLTQDFIRILNIVHLHDKNLFKSIIGIGEKEIQFVLQKVFPSLSAKLGLESNIEDIDEENESSKFIQANHLTYTNLLLLITSLNAISINSKLLDHLLQNFSSIDEELSQRILGEKLAYNIIVNNLKNFNQTQTQIESNIENKSISSLEITKREINNNILRHEHYINTFIKTTKEFKKTLFIETNKIFEKFFVLDIYIPSLKVAFIFDVNSGLLSSYPKNVIKYENSHLLYNNQMLLMKEKYDVNLFIVPDYLIEDHLLSEDSNNLLKKLIKTCLSLN